MLDVDSLRAACTATSGGQARYTTVVYEDIHDSRVPRLKQVISHSVRIPNQRAWALRAQGLLVAAGENERPNNVDDRSGGAGGLTGRRLSVKEEGERQKNLRAGQLDGTDGREAMRQGPTGLWYCY